MLVALCVVEVVDFVWLHCFCSTDAHSEPGKKSLSFGGSGVWMCAVHACVLIPFIHLFNDWIAGAHYFFYHVYCLLMSVVWCMCVGLCCLFCFCFLCLYFFPSFAFSFVIVWLTVVHVPVCKFQCGSFIKINAVASFAFFFCVEKLLHGVLFYIVMYYFFLICSCRVKPWNFSHSVHFESFCLFEGGCIYLSFKESLVVSGKFMFTRINGLIKWGRILLWRKNCG